MLKRKIFSADVLYNLLLLILLIPMMVVAEEAPAKFKIGMVLSLSGSRASIGEDARLGAELAMEQLIASGEIKPDQIDLIFEDSQGDAAKGVAAYKALRQKGVDFIVSQNSNVSLALSPLVNKEQVIQLAISCTTDKYSLANDNTFRTNGPTKPEAELMYGFLKAKLSNYKNIGIILMDDEYPVILGKYLKEMLLANDFKLFEESFIPQESNFRSIIARLQSNKVAAIVFLGYQSQAGNFVKQFRELGAPVSLLLASTPVNNREFFEIAGPGSDGVFITYPLPVLNHPAAIKFLNKSGHAVNIFSANSYDSIIIAAQTWSACNQQFSLKCFQENLYKIKNYSGLSGIKSFDDIYGDMQDSYSILQAKQGKFLPVQP